MRLIHKYELIPGVSEVSTFERVRFLHVQTQGDTPCVWAEVNPLEREQVVRVVTVPTGGLVPEGATYLGTFLLGDGVLVFHAYAEAGGVLA